MTAAMLASVFADYWNWLVEFWNLNVDRLLYTGWTTLALLTTIAALGMFIKIVKSNKELTP